MSWIGTWWLRCPLDTQDVPFLRWDKEMFGELFSSGLSKGAERIIFLLSCYRKEDRKPKRESQQFLAWISGFSTLSYWFTESVFHELLHHLQTPFDKCISESAGRKIVGFFTYLETMYTLHKNVETFH